MEILTSIGAFPMKKIREVFPNELTELEKTIISINKEIETALTLKKRHIDFQLKYPLSNEEINHLFTLYQEQEKYNMNIHYNHGLHLPVLTILW